MILVLRREAGAVEVDRLTAILGQWGLRAVVNRSPGRTVVAVVGEEGSVRDRPLDGLPGVECVIKPQKPFMLASVEFRPERSRVTLRPARPGDEPVEIGGEEIVVVGGPCSVETPEIMLETARRLRAAGARILRAGAFKPRSSPYAFQGLGVEGLRILMEVRAETGLPFITEVMDTRDVEMCAEVADLMQIGARNMQNFNLLKAVGRTRTPVMIKRGLANSIEEWLMSAEYVLSQGNEGVLLCERGIRTFERATRNTLDLNAVPVLRKWSHLPVAVDPSHGTGVAEFVAPMARAGVACGADLIMVECHPRPREAISDAAQTISLEAFDRMMAELRALAPIVGRRVREAA